MDYPIETLIAFISKNLLPAWQGIVYSETWLL